MWTQGRGLVGDMPPIPSARPGSEMPGTFSVVPISPRPTGQQLVLPPAHPMESQPLPTDAYYPLTEQRKMDPDEVAKALRTKQDYRDSPTYPGDWSSSLWDCCAAPGGCETCLMGGFSPPPTSPPPQYSLVAAVAAEEKEAPLFDNFLC